MTAAQLLAKFFNDAKPKTLLELFLSNVMVVTDKQNT